MGWSEIFILALAVSMDAMAVAAARGMLVPKVEAKHVVSIAIFFGGFQALMPLLGWLLGSTLGPIVEAYDHWIVFGVLGLLGAKMIWDGLRTPKDEAESAVDHFHPKVLFVLAIATSIDAFAVGVTLPLIGAPLLPTIVTIGLITGTLSALAVIFGGRLGAHFGQRMGVVGGLVLIGLGTKILFEHLSA